MGVRAICSAADACSWPGSFFFSLFSLLSGLSTSPAQLIAMRALQGAAGAVLAPSVFSIVSVTFDEGAERNTALGILGAIAGSGAAIGLLFGGVLTEFAGWESISCQRSDRPRRPAGGPESGPRKSCAGTGATLRRRRCSDGDGRADVVGVRVDTCADGRVGISETVASLLGFVVLIGAALLIERRSRSPLVDLRIFRRRTLTGANVIGLTLGTMTFGTFFLLTLYQQDVLGFSPLRTGLHNLAIAVTVILASSASQALVTRIGVQPVLVFGLLVLGGGLAYFTQLPVDGTYLTDLLPGFLLIGVGLGFSFVPVSIAALTGITDREAGLASGLINTSQQIGGALGLAILTTVSTTRTDHLLAQNVSTPTALTEGYKLAFWVGVGFAAVAVSLALFVLRPGELRPEAKQESRVEEAADEQVAA